MGLRHILSEEEVRKLEVESDILMLEAERRGGRLGGFGWHIIVPCCKGAEVHDFEGPHEAKELAEEALRIRHALWCYKGWKCETVLEVLERIDPGRAKGLRFRNIVEKLKELVGVDYSDDRVGRAVKAGEGKG